MSLRPDRSARALARPAVAAVLALTLTAAACGGTSTSPTDALSAASSEADTATDTEASSEAAPADSGEAAAEAPAGSAENQLPQVDVIDLATGDQVNLASFAPSATPIVLWFWAPH